MAVFTQSISAAEVLAGLTSDSIKWKGADIGARLNVIDFWSDVNAASITVDTTAGTEALPSVTLPNITGKTIIAAYAMVLSSSLRNSAAANGLINSAQEIQVDKAAAGYINAIGIVEYDARLDAGASAYNVLWLGSDNIITRVAFNGTTDFRWLNADYSVDSLVMYGVRTGVRVIV